MTTEWRVERSEAAINDILDIWDHLALHDDKAADRFIEAVESGVSRLLDFPRLGSGRETLPEDLRALSLWPFLLIYRLVEDCRCIQIIRVIDARRDFGSLSFDQ